MIWFCLTFLQNIKEFKKKIRIVKTTKGYPFLGIDFEYPKKVATLKYRPKAQDDDHLIAKKLLPLSMAKKHRNAQNMFSFSDQEKSCENGSKTLRFFEEIHVVFFRKISNCFV